MTPSCGSQPSGRPSSRRVSTSPCARGTGSCSTGRSSASHRRRCSFKHLVARHHAADQEQAQDVPELQGVHTLAAGAAPRSTPSPRLPLPAGGLGLLPDGGPDVLGDRGQVLGMASSDPLRRQHGELKPVEGQLVGVLCHIMDPGGASQGRWAICHMRRRSSLRTTG